MRTITTLLAVAGLMAGSATAFAQTQQGSSSAQSGTSQTQQQSATKPPSAMTQDRLKQVLTQAGFQNVQIVDASYLVQARTKEGDSVLMLINPPDPMRGASAASSSAGTAGAPGSTGSTTSGSSPSSNPSATK